jgi:hypothetical protein
MALRGLFRWVPTVRFDLNQDQVPKSKLKDCPRCPLVALSGHSVFAPHMSAFDKADIQVAKGTFHPGGRSATKVRFCAPRCPATCNKCAAQAA